MKPSSLPHRVLGLFCLLLALAAVGLGVPAYQRKLVSFQPLGFAASAGAGFVEVTQVERAETGLAAGDRIVAASGAAVDSASALASRLRAADETRLLVLRGEGLVELAYQRPALDLDIPFLLLSLVGLIYLAIGLFALWRAERGALFFLWSLASAVLYLYSPTPPYDGLGRTVFLVEQLARLFLPPLTLHLFLSIPRPAARSRWRAFLYLPAALLLAAQLDLALAGGRLFLGSPTAATLALLDRLELWQFALGGLAAAALLLWQLRRLEGWQERRQVQWLGIGAFAGYLPFALAYVLPRSLGWTASELASSLAVLPLAVVPLTFSWALLRYRLWDFGVMVRAGLSYGLTILLGLGSFSLFDLMLQRLLPEHWGVSRDAASFLVGLALAGLVIPVERRVAGALERLQYRSAYRRRRGLAALGQELLHVRDLPQLCASLTEGLAHGLQVQRTELLLAHAGRLLPTAPSAVPQSLDAADLAPAFWQLDYLTLSPVALPSDAGAPFLAHARAGFRYAFPLVVRQRPVGLFLATDTLDGLPWSSEDLDLARQILDQAALALENAQLLGEVQRRLAEVTHLQVATEGILESSPAGIAVLDETGRIVRANAAFAALVGAERAALAGREALSLLGLAELPAPGTGVVQVALAAEPEERTLQLSLAALAGAERGGERILVAQDVSERVKIERTLKEQDRLASLGLLAAGVAHEVNTPLTGISSYAQLLLSDTDAADPRFELLKKVERQTFRAARIVNNLLDFARDRKGERGPVDLVELLTDCADLLRERLTKNGIVLDWQPPAAAVEVLATESELQQVVTNLMLNAIDALSPRGGRISLRCRVEQRRARLEVEDDGPGIAPEHLDKVFLPFFTTKLGKGGTGLGLAISQQIVVQHGGELSVESRPGEGTRFVVELPARDSAPSA